MTDPELLNIHKQLHSSQTILFKDKLYPIAQSNHKRYYAIIEEFVFERIIQDNTLYGQMAKDHKITCVIKADKWFYIIDDVIQHP